jgi:hypothetical protein
MRITSRDHDQCDELSRLVDNHDHDPNSATPASQNEHDDMHLSISNSDLNHTATDMMMSLTGTPQRTSALDMPRPAMELAAGPLLGDVWLEKLRKRLTTADLRAGRILVFFCRFALCCNISSSKSREEVRLFCLISTFNEEMYFKCIHTHARI